MTCTVTVHENKPSNFFNYQPVTYTYSSKQRARKILKDIGYTYDRKTGTWENERIGKWAIID